MADILEEEDEGSEGKAGRTISHRVLLWAPHGSGILCHWATLPRTHKGTQLGFARLPSSLRSWEFVAEQAGEIELSTPPTLRGLSKR